MLPFEYFIEQKEVKKCSTDLDLAKSLIKEMKERIEKSLILDISVFSKFIFENIYDGLRDFCDALLAVNGYKSYSHQASISYLVKEGFDISIIEEFDQLRHKRNSSKYYGESVSKEDAIRIKEFYFKLKEGFDKKIRNKKIG
jgi:hypothetical protein